MTEEAQLLADIAGVAGADAAMSVARARGGTEVYFPNPRTIQKGYGAWLVKAVGKDTALKIAKAPFPMGCWIYIPMGRDATRRTTVLELTRAGRGVNEIARLIGCSNRTVYRDRKRLKKEDLL